MSDTGRNRMAVEVFDRRAQQYHDKYMDVSLYHDSFNLFCSGIVPAGRVLDVACGPGNITKYLLEKRPDLKILGIDLAPNMVELAKANNPGAAFGVMDGREIGSLSEKFDGIMCGFLFPYLSKEEAVQFIADAAQKLNTGGVLYISTMEGDYTTSAPQTSSSGDTIFIHYHEETYLAGAIKHTGLDIIAVQRKEYYMGDMPVTDLIIIASAAMGA